MRRGGVASWLFASGPILCVLAVRAEVCLLGERTTATARRAHAVRRRFESEWAAARERTTRSPSSNVQMMATESAAAARDVGEKAPEIRAAYDRMSAAVRETTRLEEVLGLLGWDEQVMMPVGSAEARGRQKAAVAAVLHDKHTGASLADAINELKTFGSESVEAVLDEYERANVRDATRRFERKQRMSRELAAREAELTSRAYQVWVEAREKSDFSMFAPVLEELLEHTKLVASLTKPGMDAYDAAIDEFERGMSAARLSEIFDSLREPLKALLDDILAAQSAGRAPNEPVNALQGGPQWDEDKQELFCREVAAAVGFDSTRGRLDRSVHPFTGGCGPQDVRMTTRFSEQNWPEGIMGLIHEAGHAMYEQGRRTGAHDALPVSEPLSYGVHESQSLLWERCVGQSEQFWEWALPVAARSLPHLAVPDVTPRGAYEALNQVRPSLIRVDADEVTYSFHILVRFEIERALFDGSLKVADLPRVWNEKMQAYLGVVPSSDTDGVLQDVHWSGAAFGYFPSYSLGAMMAVQIFEAACRELPSLQSDIARGEFGALRSWLNEKVHRVGSLYPSPDKLLLAVTGAELEPQIFVRYLRNKYADLYGIDPHPN